jgi:hypothetical protein
MADSTWYVAVLVLQSRVVLGTMNRSSITKVRLLQAPNADAAFARAMQLGEKHELTYSNEAGETVSWDFLGLADLEELGRSRPNDGDEVFSWLTRGPGREFVHKRDDLTVFANARNAHKTARELLDD